MLVNRYAGNVDTYADLTGCVHIVMFIDSSDKYDIQIKHNNTI